MNLLMGASGQGMYKADVIKHRRNAGLLFEKIKNDGGGI